MVRPITRKNPRKRAPPARKRGGETPWRVRVARLVKRSSTGAWDAVRALEASRRADLVVRQMYYVRSQLVVWFNTLDDNGDAFLSRDELAAGLAESFGVDAASAPYVAAEIIRRADDDDDGVLTLGELLGMVRRATEQYKLWRECRDALRKIGLSIFVYLPAVATAMALPLGLLMSWAEGWTYEKGFWVALAELCMTNIKIVRDNSPRGDAGTAAAALLAFDALTSFGAIPRGVRRAMDSEGGGRREATPKTARERAPSPRRRARDGDAGVRGL